MLGVGPCQERKCWSAFGEGAIFMLSRIELVGALRFDLWDGGEGALMAGLAGDGDGEFMDSLRIQLLKSSCSLEMAVRFS